jgi:ribonuclease BN (tRNA processing enzyme)
VIGPRGTKQLFRSLFTTLPGFRQAPFAVRFKEVSDRAFWIGKTKIVPRTVTHSPELHCLGYRIEYGGKVLAYSGDSQYCSNLVRLCGEADLAVLDCSFPANRPGPVHLHAGECGQVAREAGVGQLVLSHFYPIAERYDVKSQAGETYGGKILLARDRLTFRL